MRLGSHLSTAGGVTAALHRGLRLGCDTIQIFTKNNNRWQAPPIPAGEAAEFRRLRREAGFDPLIAHTAYLINLASPDPAIRQRSSAALLDELERCELLGLDGLVMHPGCPGGDGEQLGLERIMAGIRQALSATSGAAVRLLLENTAGQGSCLGHRFEELRSILDGVGRPGRTGVCLDTCHLFAAGYDIRTPAAYGATMAEVDRVLGAGAVRVIHLNDSKKPLGSRVDRHEHIGDGLLGLEAFRLFSRDPRWADTPGILETPKDADLVLDRRNLALLRRLREDAGGESDSPEGPAQPTK